MTSKHFFANANNLKLRRFFALSTIAKALGEGFVAGLVACGLLVAAFHYILGLWFLALLLLTVAGAFSYGLVMLHRALWGK